MILLNQVSKSDLHSQGFYDNLALYFILLSGVWFMVASHFWYYNKIHDVTHHVDAILQQITNSEERSVIVSTQLVALRAWFSVCVGWLIFGVGFTAWLLIHIGYTHFG